MSRSAAISSRASSSAATATARIPTRSSVCSPSAGLKPACAARSPSLLPGLRGDLLYSQVPALSAGDRGLLDLLTLDRNGRLAVIELKADEDLHLPLQALDYWIRVRALNNDRQPMAGNEGGRPLSAFERQGYFAGAEVSPFRRACCWPPRLCASTPPTSRCCATSPLRSSGS